MANVSCTPGKPGVKNGSRAKGDVTGIIAMNSPQGNCSLAISFESDAIFNITNKMLGESVSSIDDTVTDLVGEVTNMATGNAKLLLESDGYDFTMATPIVVKGAGHEIKHAVEGKIIVIPFETGAGKFYIEVGFDR